jgi:redox-sensitive bicupin YhaK (pirin superfamily)
MTPTPTIDHRPADSRFHTDIGWLDSWHSFSFGEHYDAANTGHGLLIVSNDDRVAPAGGFGTHGHRDMEIVTWVLDGELEHRDSIGTNGVIYPGLAQRMSAGSGIRHSEMNHSSTMPVHFVQMWVVPDQYGIEPGYEQLDVGDRLAEGGLVAVASGRGHSGAITIHQQGAVMWVGRLSDGETVTLPDAPYVHVFAARGDVRFGDTTLREGDAARLTDAGPLELTAQGDAEVIVWESDAAATR